MPNFEVVPRQYKDLPEFLIRSVPGFSESPEFGLVAGTSIFPG
jgi:hypothetical protein